MEAYLWPPLLRMEAHLEMLLLFEHTAQGNKALRELDDAGVAHDAIRVVGDLGPPAGQPGAERHVTLDRLHVPAEERQIYMETIRDGGVVLGVDMRVVDAAFAERVGEKHGAMRMTRSSGAVANPSHNTTR